jgi:hypothetical protein
MKIAFLPDSPALAVESCAAMMPPGMVRSNSPLSYKKIRSRPGDFFRVQPG